MWNNKTLYAPTGTAWERTEVLHASIAPATHKVLIIPPFSRHHTLDVCLSERNPANSRPTALADRRKHRETTADCASTSTRRIGLCAAPRLSCWADGRWDNTDRWCLLWSTPKALCCTDPAAVDLSAGPLSHPPSRSFSQLGWNSPRTEDREHHVSEDLLTFNLIITWDGASMFPRETAWWRPETMTQENRELLITQY